MPFLGSSCEVGIVLTLAERLIGLSSEMLVLNFDCTYISIRADNIGTVADEGCNGVDTLFVAFDIDNSIVRKNL